MRRWRPIVMAALSATSVPAGARTWGERLLAETAHRHSGIAGLRIEAVGRAGRPIVVGWGSVVPASTTVPLADAMHRPIGTLRVFGQAAGATTIAASLSRHLYVADNLDERDPFVAGAVHYPRAQAMVDAAIAADSDMVTLAMHVAPPGGINVIVASSFGRIGKAADGDDEEVVAGATRRETTDDGARLAVELPLLDRAGRTIGALSTSFLVRNGDLQAAYARALAVRAGLARRTRSLAALTRRQATAARQLGTLRSP